MSTVWGFFFHAHKAPCILPGAQGVESGAAPDPVAHLTAPGGPDVAKGCRSFGSGPFDRAFPLFLKFFAVAGGPGRKRQPEAKPQAESNEF